MIKNTIVYISLIISTLAIMLSACDQTGTNAVKEEVLKEEKVDKTRFPNKRSELAILMRNMQDELMAAKNEIPSGEFPNYSLVKKFGSIKTATPTDAKNSGPVFQSFASKFLADMKSFEEAAPENKVKIFNGMVQSCLDCHQEYCHGPMVAIRKLKL